MIVDEMPECEGKLPIAKQLVDYAERVAARSQKASVYVSTKLHSLL